MLKSLTRPPNRHLEIEGSSQRGNQEVNQEASTILKKLVLSPVNSHSFASLAIRHRYEDRDTTVDYR